MQACFGKYIKKHKPGCHPQQPRNLPGTYIGKDPIAKAVGELFQYFRGSFWPSKDIFCRIFLKDASGFVAGAVMRSPESMTLKGPTIPISITGEVQGKLMRSLWEMGGHIS